ncbi:MAG TPA: cation:proton antiporter [Candidatus Limnocylindrales bacterium]|nr:cation:proton antiporter [Candidatus Limnocylindrales bacterium]
MVDETASAFEVALILIGGAFIGVAISARIGLPSVLGYLAAGLILGPAGSGALTQGAGVDQFAELGVILLLFTLGLDFSLSRLIELRRMIFGVGLAEVLVVTGLVAFGAGYWFGVGPPAAILVGGAVAMSSTALCLKQLSEQHELGTRHGRIAVAVLLLQDLATAFFLILLGVAAGGASLVESLGQFGVGIFILVAALLLMRALLRPVTAWLAAHANSDLLQLTALLIALGAAYVADLAGLSPAIGAFLAGMLISESDARHVVEKEIRPFRDLLVGIFFVSVGTQIEPLRIAEAPLQVLGWLLMVVALKLVVVAIIVRLSGEAPAVALRAGTILAHGGEFGLLLISLGMKQGILVPDMAQPLFIALGISIFVAPLLIRLDAPIGPRLAVWRR